VTAAVIDLQQWRDRRARRQLDALLADPAARLVYDAAVNVIGQQRADDEPISDRRPGHAS
jgi:hypothetical protein